MTELVSLETSGWSEGFDPATCSRVTQQLETGNILFLPRLCFDLAASESRFLSPQWSDGKAKNVSYDPQAAEIRHTSAQGSDRQGLAAMMARYARQARELVTSLCPAYTRHLRWGLISFRPVEVEGRAASPKKDDTRLHVDAFASRPTQGLRILRVFCNVNPQGRPRVWNIGEPFDAVVERFHARVPPQIRGSAWLFERLHITKGRRSPYDHIMLNLHDRPKLDEEYQRTTARTRVEFAAQTTWLVFSDRVMHAALRGQHLLEQTFYLPVEGMQEQRYAPLRILEQVYQRKLA
jgi:hypothetical protein